MKKRPIKNPLDINELFSKGTVRSRGFFTRPQIPTQLKMLLRTVPDYEVLYATDEDGREIKVAPRRKSIKELLRLVGRVTQLRGIGFTRKNKSKSKASRNMEKRSRKINRGTR